jgi:hypothetical protein
MHVSASTVECINRLLERVPELRPAYDEHVRDNGQLLPHVFFGDVTRYVLRQVRDGNTAASHPVGQILGCLEHCMASGSEDVKELVSVSFIENLLGNDDVLATLKGMMGPNLLRGLAAHGM